MACPRCPIQSGLRRTCRRQVRRAFSPVKLRFGVGSPIFNGSRSGSPEFDHNTTFSPSFLSSSLDWLLLCLAQWLRGGSILQDSPPKRVRPVSWREYAQPLVPGWVGFCLFGCLLAFGFVWLFCFCWAGTGILPTRARGRHSFFSLIETVLALPPRLLHAAHTLRES